MFVLVSLVSVVTPLGAESAVPTEPTVERLSGPDRAATAIAISQAAYAEAPAVVLTRADAYPDALAAGPLAASLGGPVLLTPGSALDGAVAAEVQRLGASRAVLIGGTAALSPAVEAGLRAAGVVEIERIAGANRFETAARVAQRVGGQAVYVTEGANPDSRRGWPDAVAVSGLAAYQGRPILLVTRDRAPDETLRALAELGATTITIVGGSAAVSDQVRAQLTSSGASVDRVAGGDRYETSRAIADLSVVAGASPDDVWIATGRAWPDALAAGPTAAHTGAVLLLVDGGRPEGSPATSGWPSERGLKLRRVVIVGGLMAITAATGTYLLGLWAADPSWQAVVENLGSQVYGQRPGYVPPSGGVVVLPAGSYDANAAVQGYGSGTVFVLRAGLHRWSSRVEPKSEMEFHGEPGAVISGAKVLSGWSREGSLWWASHRAGLAHHSSARCRDEFVDAATDVHVCRDPNAAFLDDVPLRQHVRKADVAPGGYWLDYDRDRIYLGDDPAGRLVEVSVTDHAFRGANPEGRTGVVIRNVVVEKFGTRPQRGAIHSGDSHAWLVQDVTARLNYAHGIRVSGSHGVIRGSAAVDNGQMGITGGGGSSGGWAEQHDLLVEHTEIARNGDWAGIRGGWEAGGSKWANTTNLTVRRNWVHHNHHTGLWTDINNYNTLFEENLVEANNHTGIFHEISYDAVIRRNIVRGNGHINQSSFAGSSGIRVANSQRVQVLDNIVEDNWNHIVLSSSATGSHTKRFAPYDDYILSDVLVRANTVRIGSHGIHGAVRSDGTSIFDPARNLRFRENRYHTATATTAAFAWADTTLTYTQWQTHGQDVAVTEHDTFAGRTVTYTAGTHHR